MARQFKAWLGSLIEAEVDDVIAWKKVVKREPGTAGVEDYDRFRDDGSNFRSTVGTPPLNADCKLQILQTPESRRQPALVTDGETQVKAKLSAAAWDSYEDALDGEDSMRGDILICTGVTVCSTSFGPLDERIQLLLTGVEFKGDNVRKTVGQPISVEKRPRILELLGEITRLRAFLNGSGMDEDMIDDQDENTPDAGPQASAGGQQEVNDFQRAVETQVQQQSSEQLFETQAPVMDAPLPSRNHPRVTKSRGRGGLSLARDGVEAARGVNLTEPQAPGLVTRKRKHDNSLLNLMNNGAAAPHQLSPAVHSTPRSAQIRQEDTLETPAQPAKHSQVIATQQTAYTISSASSPRSSRKPYRIPSAQRRLLDDKSSWYPPAPGSRFPHPNVPVALLDKWNSRGQTQSQPAPKVPIEISSEDSDASGDSSEAQPGAVASESEDDQRLEWHSSPSQQNKLPPDSSADSPLKRNEAYAQPRKPPSFGAVSEYESERSRPSTSHSNRSLTKANATPIQSKSQSDVSVDGSARSTSSRNNVNKQPPNSGASQVLATKTSSHDRMPASTTQHAQHSSLANQELANTHTFKNLNISPSKGSASQTRADGGFMMQPPGTIKKSPHARHAQQKSASSQQASQVQSSAVTTNQDRRIAPPERPSEATQRRSDSRPTSAAGSNSTPSADPRRTRYSQEFRLSQEEQASLRSPASQTSQSATRGFKRPPPTGPRAERDRLSRKPPSQIDNMGMDMEAPRASNDYQQARSEFYRGAGRRRYIQTQLPALLEQDPRLDFLLQSYRAAKPSDPISAEDFLHAVELLDPDSLARIEQDVESLASEPSPTPPEASWPPTAEEPFGTVNPFAVERQGEREMEEREEADANESEGDGRERETGEREEAEPEEAEPEEAEPEEAERYEAKRQLEKVVTTLHRAQNSKRKHISVGISTPNTKNGVSNATRQDAEQNPSAPVPRFAQSGKPRAVSASSGLVEHSGTEQSTMKGDLERRVQGLSAFEEFALRWKSISPSGAFARPASKPRARGRTRQLDVLGWEL